MKHNTAPQNALLICIGNDYRQDDGVGLFIGRLEKVRNMPGLRIIENHGDGMALMEAWKGEELVLLVDAVQSGRPAGTIVRFDVLADALPDDIMPTSTHNISLQDSVALSRSLGLLPGKLIFYGIEGEDFGHGEGLSDAVKAAAVEVAERIEGELHC